MPGEWGGRIDLSLDAPSWSGWRSFCDILGIYIGPGRPPWANETADDTSRLLVSTGYFSEAACDVQEGGLAIVCSLKPARIVQEIAFTGEVPSTVLVDDLRRRVFLRPGTLLGEDEREVLERQRRRLEDFLRREGYFGSIVRIRPVITGGALPNEGVRLEAEVRPGRTVKVREVEIHGNNPLEKDEIISFFFHNRFLWWFPVRFRPIQFEDDIESLTRFFHDKGYPEARVSGEWRLDLPNNAVDLLLRIDSGPHVQVEFTGNNRLRRRHLRELVTFEEAGIIDPFEIEETAGEIRLRHQEVGFDSPAVKNHFFDEGEGRLKIVFEIEEGPRRFIRKISFSGNDTYPDNVLLDRINFMSSTKGFMGGGQYVETWMDADRRSIQTFYREEGYGAVRVSTYKNPLDDKSLEAGFSIEEGARRIVGEMNIEGLPQEVDVSALMNRLRLTGGAPFVQEFISQDHRELLATLAAHGYTRGDIIRDMDVPPVEEGGTATISYRVIPGPKSYFGGVLVRGNFRTRSRLVEDQLSLMPGDELDLIVLGLARRRLRALGPFASVDLSPLDDWRGHERTWLLVEVQERDVRVLDGVFAFSTDDRFSLGADYRDHNILGRAIRLDLRLRLGRIFGELMPRLTFFGHTDSFDGQMRAPSPMGMPFDVEASTYYLHESTSRHRQEYLAIGSGLIRDFGRKAGCEWCPSVVGKLRYEVAAGIFESHSGDPDDISASGHNSAGRANIGRIIPALSFDRKNAFVDPTHGYSAELRFELAARSLAPIGEGYSFTRIIAGSQFYVTLGYPLRQRLTKDRYFGGRLVLAGAGTFGGGRPFGLSDELPEAERFFYGGDYSVRGLNARASRPGAPYMMINNIELRWYMLEGMGFGTLQLAVFADSGTVAESPGELFEELSIGVGPAIRYVTPVGPISISWGIPVSLPERIAEEMSERAGWGKLHLTFGYAF